MAPDDAAAFTEVISDVMNAIEIVSDAVTFPPAAITHELAFNWPNNSMNIPSR